MSDTALDPAVVRSVRQRLWDAGFRPLAIYNIDEAVASPGKRPVGGDWTNRARLNPPEAVNADPWPKALNTGILCDGLRAMDVDIDDSQLAHRICSLAAERFGPTIKRWRSNSGRSLLVYRAAEGEPDKRSLAGKLGKIEFLGHGQQFVSHGLHPTGAVLQWAPDALEQFPRETLPAISEDQITGFFAEVAPLIEAELVKPNGIGNGHASDRGLEANMLEVAAALSAIPNTGPSDWEYWNKIGMATYAATSGSTGGFDAWVAWSKRHPSFDPAHAAERWDNYGRSPPTQIGAGTLFHLAKEAKSRKFDRNKQASEPPPPTGEADYGAVDPDGWFFDENKPEQSGPIDSPNLDPSKFTAEYLDTQDFPPVEWIIAGVLPTGQAILAGKSKIGKSWLAMDIAIAVARGSPVFEKIETMQCDVLYAALEDPPRRLQSRMRMLLKGQPAPANLTFATAWPNMDQGCIAAIEQAVTTNPRIRLVMIDTFGKVRGKPDGRSGVYQQDYQDMGAFHALANRLNICILLIHHTRKQDASDVMDLISGSTGIVGAADTIMVLQRKRDEQAGSLSITGRDIIDDGEFALTFHKAEGKWEWLGEAKQVQRDTIKQKIIQLLLAEPEPLGPTDIANELELALNTVKSALRRLLKAGAVFKAGEGLWTAKSPS